MLKLTSHLKLQGVPYFTFLDHKHILMADSNYHKYVCLTK